MITDEKQATIDHAKRDAAENAVPSNEAAKLDLPITGMTCAACANRVEKSLAR
jgi:hypothetical protein